jgi:anti-sigma B factor antagonist
MTITERQVGSATVLKVTGRIISDDTGQLKDKVTSLFGAGRSQIVLDLGGVTFIDSTGLGELISCHTTAVRQKSAIKLINLGKRSIELLVVTKLISVFDVYETEAEALASFTQTV